MRNDCRALQNGGGTVENRRAHLSNNVISIVCLWIELCIYNDVCGKEGGDLVDCNQSGRFTLHLPGFDR